MIPAVTSTNRPTRTGRRLIAKKRAVMIAEKAPQKLPE
jgi:hypothetical protein